VFGELPPHFHIERIARLGPVEPDQGDAVGGVFEQYDRGGHLQRPSVD
jgi:hypothetical protein